MEWQRITQSPIRCEVHFDFQHPQTNRYQNASQEGSVEALLSLGLLLEKGLGVDKNISLAKDKFQAAANAQNVEAMFRLGKLLEKEAATESSPAQSHDHSIHAEAVHWFMKAASHDHSHALNALGSCYFFGKGVPQDYSKAVFYFRKSSQEVNSLLTFFQLKYRIMRVHSTILVCVMSKARGFRRI